MSSPASQPRKTRARAASIIFAAVIVLAVLVVGPFMVLGWSAERSARQFCDSITPGSDISRAIARFEAIRQHGEALHQASADGHSFTFLLTMDAQGHCEVGVDGRGLVTSRRTFTVLD